MKFVLTISAILLLTGCVQNRAVQTVQPGDFTLNCEQLQFELASLGAEFDEAADESGVTGNNVALGIFFWPGIIVNEVRANENQDSISARIEHLGLLYRDKCVGQDQSVNE